MGADFSGLDSDGYSPLIGVFLVAVVTVPLAISAHKHLTQNPSPRSGAIQTVPLPANVNASTQSGLSTPQASISDALLDREATLQSIPGAAQSDADQSQLSTLENSAEAIPPTSPYSSRSGLEDLDFDLAYTVAEAGNGSSDIGMAKESVTVRKPLVSSEGQLGSLTVSIDENARIFVKASTIKTILADAGAPPSRLARIPDQPMVSFQRLRELGVDLKYDPIEDQIILK